MKKIDEITTHLLKVQDQLILSNPILKTLDNQKKQIDLAINNILSAIERGVVTNTTTKRLKDLESKQEELDKEILIERSKTQTKVTEKSIKEFFELGLQLEPIMLINYFIKEIILYDNEVKIYFNNPLPISPDKSQDFSFYDKKIYIPKYAKNGYAKGKTDIKVTMTI